jgi:hypothetical protein
MPLEFQILNGVGVLCGCAIALQLFAWNRVDHTAELEGTSADGECAGDGGSCGTC